MPRKILIVDDNAINRLMLKNTLCREYDVIEAENGREALYILNRSYKMLSAVLTDIVMPEMDGYELLRRIRDNTVLSQLPVIMVTGSEDEQSRVKALSLGANDFILKPFNPEIVKHCVKNNIALRETASILNAIQKDKLTGLYNREAFFERVSGLIADREPGYYLLSSFDIDSFKLINDQYGDAEGDRILREIGREVGRQMEGAGGIGGRISGDNFAVLLPVSNKEMSITHHIQQGGAAFSDKQTVVFSVGRYIISDITLPASTIYDRAYIAKQSVKGRYDEHIAYFDDTMLEKLIRGQRISAEMDAAIAKRQFEVWFQPQHNHATGALVGAEALARWRHPEKGLIPPGDFIPIFEQNGFVYELDKYVWREACRCLRKWLDEGRDPLPVSVNISRYDVFRADFVDALTGIVREYSIPAELLRLEITESAFAKSTKVIVSIVRKLVERGFIVEIDDFGSGYSSLNTLKSVPAQVVKLDMRFLEEDDDSGRGGNILESVVRMTKWLGMSVIAEGVEDKTQADYLTSVGCSYIQGYLYARPMPEAEYEDYCSGAGKEERLLSMESVANLNNNSFWDPQSMDTLIFNSYVGAACIFEYHDRSIELLRVNTKFTSIFGEGVMSVEDTLRLDWMSCLTPEGLETVRGVLQRSSETGEEYTREYVFLNLTGAQSKTYLRSTMRVIATAGERMLVYCTSENMTAQREAEESERSTQEQMRSIMTNINSGICAVMLDGKKIDYLFVNDRYFEIHGYTREQFKAEVGDIYGLFHPDDRQRVFEETQRVNVIGRTAVIEYRVIRRDGGEAWVRTSISTRAFEGAERPVQVSVITDITSERLASERLQAIMRDVGCGITAAVLDDDGNIELLFTNDKFFELHGYSRERYEAEIKDKYACIHPDDREKARRDTVQAYTTQTPAQLEYRLICPDETVRWVRVALSSTRFTGIERNVHLCIFTDISAEKQADQKTKEASARLQAMMDDMPGGFARMRVDPDGRLSHSYFNDTYCTMRGMTRDEIIKAEGNNALVTVHPDDLPNVQKTVRESLSSGDAVNLKYRLLCGGGEYRWFSVFGRKTREKNGDVFVNAYYTDVSAQVGEEETQRTLMDNLPGGAGLYEYKDGRLSVIYLNKSYWELVGRKTSDYAAMSALSAVHPEDVAIVSRELASAVSQGRDMACDFRLRHESGRYDPVHLVGRVVKGENGAHSIYTTFTPISREAMSVQEMLPVAIQSMMDSSSEVAFIKGQDLRYISCSRRFALLSGRASEKELLGKRSYDVFPPELAARNDEVDREVLQTGNSSVDQVMLFPAADGMRQLMFSKYPLKDAEGNVLGIYGTGRDITETRKMQSQLELLSNNIPGGIAVYEGHPDALDRIRLAFFSDGFCRIFGYSREEYEKLAEVNPLGLVASEDISKMYESVMALVRDGVPMDFIYRANVKGGKNKWVNVKAVMGEPDGEKLTVNAVFYDVTEQKEASEKLRISEEINRLAILQSGNIVCRYDVASKQLSVSPNVDPIFELAETEEDIPEKTLRNGCVSPETIDAYSAFYDAILRGDKSGEALFQRRSTLGWRWVREHFTTIFSDSGRPDTAVISFADITESVEKDAAYRRWQQSLQSRPPESYTLFRCIIGSVTSYDIREGSLLTVSFEPGTFEFDAHTEQYVAQYVVPEDKAPFLALVRAETLLEKYRSGDRSISMEYRELLPGGELRWMRLTIELVEHTRSTDVEAYMLFENIDDAKHAELELIARAETDPLTGLLNRKVFEQKVNDMISASKPGTSHALLMLDIDEFKKINDEHGHTAGDAALIEASNILKRSLADSNAFLARYGGDEFAVVLYYTGEEQIQSLISRITGETDRLSSSGAAPYKLVFSLGYVCYDKRRYSNYQDMITAADAHMYMQKKQHKAVRR